TGCFRRPKPNIRKSMITIAPNIMVSARMWMVSITGKAQMVSAMAWPIHVWLLHSKNGFRDSHILEVIGGGASGDNNDAPADQRDPAGQFRGAGWIFGPLPLMHAAVDLRRMKNQNVQSGQK